MRQLKWGVFGAIAAALLLAAAGAHAQTDLADYFGFEGQRIIVVGDDAGPAISADFNADGRPDLAVVNNRKSRIELLLLRDTPRTEEQMRRTAKPNELAESPWYDVVKIGVAHRVTALRAHDVDDDGDLDIAYVGAAPAELVILRQAAPVSFDVASRRRVPDLSAGAAGFVITDVIDGPRPELVTLVDGRIHAFPLGPSGAIAEPTPIGSGEGVVAVFVEDFDGDRVPDLLGVVPDDVTPLRLWLREPGEGLSPEMRFEMPALTEAEPVRLPGRPRAAIGVIERSSRRMVFYELEPGDVPTLASTTTQRDAQTEVIAFPEGASKQRSVVVSDIDGNGLHDVIATDRQSNSITLMLQKPGRGIGPARAQPTFKEPKVVGAGPWREGGETALFVLSEEERVLGHSVYDAQRGRLPFPEPVSVATAGATPVMMRPVQIDGSPALAVVVKERRDYVLEVHIRRDMGVEVAKFDLDDARREPETILAADADRDGRTDLMLLTPGEPMAMLRSAGDVPALLGKDDMPQFGLVEAAGPANTAVVDIDDDGRPEVLIADENFVRACAYDPETGWVVLQQINASGSRIRFAGIDVLDKGDERIIVAADADQDRLHFLGRDATGAWGPREVIRVLGFELGRIIAGSFTGDGQPGVLCVGEQGLGLVRLGGARPTLEDFAAYRPDAEDRFEHEIEVGDLNADGYTDLVVLDARERICAIYTFSASRKLLKATEFEIFESRLFSGSQNREYEPSAAIVADLTGDGRDDLALVVHDRVIVYPQATAP